MTPEERDSKAAEYVLGTLPVEERAEVEHALADDPDLAAAVRAWEDRLSPLDAGTAPVDPPARVWLAIDRALGAGGAPAVRPAVLGARSGDVVDLTRRLNRWRGFAAGISALAAALAAFVVYDVIRPVAPEDGRFVAVVNSDGAKPALIVSVDTAAGTVTVRSVAAEQPADRSLELWHIAEGGTPVSLGVLDPAAPVLRIPAERAGPSPTSGVFAVSVEPVGGSPTGGPTGPVVYSGALIPETP
ncbi:anti-sigma factor [Chthonobacter albigriseus]|uniref:anti-sigma factor n=1 Tax=Chthonobacter albigriseus TaxID=1683161 RepID=UPI0015EFA2B5|nr:anti-sigma factor [Chthonobacter albigriseus]